MLEGPLRQFRILESRLNLADRRLSDQELRLAALEDGIWQAEQALMTQTSGQLFWTTATGCNTLALAGETMKAALMWTGIYDPTLIADQIADPSSIQTLTADGSGFVKWLGVWPNWVDPGSGTVLPIQVGGLSSPYNLKKVGSNYYYDNIGGGGFQGFLEWKVYPSIDLPYGVGSIYYGNGYQVYRYADSNMGICSGCQPGINPWNYAIGSQGSMANSLCWAGYPRPFQAHTITVTVAGGGGGAMPGYYGNLNSNRNIGSVHGWSGGSWLTSFSLGFTCFWSFNQSTKALTCTIWHVNTGGFDAAVAPGSEGIGTPTSTSVTSTQTPTVTTGPFTATYDFTGTAIQTYGGITTVTVT